MVDDSAPPPAAGPPAGTGADTRATAPSPAALATRFAVPVLWGLLPFVGGPAFAEALDPCSRPVQVVASVGLWLAWAVALALALVPRSTSLTGLRIIVPVAIPAGLWALLAAPTIGASALLGLALAIAATVVGFAPAVGDLFVNGSAYGDERRMPLRAPAGLLVGPIELAWLVCVAGAIAGPLLLAAQSWVLGGLLLVVGWPAAFVAARALHGLAQRWIVFVPIGFVLHDQMAVTDPILMPRRMVTSVGPAPADTRATDLTLGSYGLALQVDLTDPTPVGLVPRRTRPGQRPTTELVEVQSILFTPSRPGAVLREAAARRLPVG